mmetsp:Transcript_4711/g.8220  ORF Transcript_4711/g.8220 Transcript_4711/m.8220 type:complete len:225 (-) Transcript_4711:368-1042(-)
MVCALTCLDNRSLVVVDSHKRRFGILSSEHTRRLSCSAPNVEQLSSCLQLAVRVWVQLHPAWKQVLVNRREEVCHSVVHWLWQVSPLESSSSRVLFHENRLQLRENPETVQERPESRKRVAVHAEEQCSLWRNHIALTIGRFLALEESICDKAQRPLLQHAHVFDLCTRRKLFNRESVRGSSFKNRKQVEMHSNRQIGRHQMSSGISHEESFDSTCLLHIHFDC